MSLVEMWANAYEQDPRGAAQSLAEKTEFDIAVDEWGHAEPRLIAASRIYFGRGWRRYLAEVRDWCTQQDREAGYLADR